jgi:hypothetical protein
VSRKEKFKSKKTKKQKGRAGAPTYNPSYSGGGSGGSWFEAVAKSIRSYLKSNLSQKDLELWLK